MLGTQYTFFFKTDEYFYVCVQSQTCSTAFIILSVKGVEQGKPKVEEIGM